MIYLLQFQFFAVSGQVKHIENSITQVSSFIGELSLDGNINPVKGIISMAEFCRNRKKVFLCTFKKCRTGSIYSWFKFCKMQQP